ncbi:MAG: hypothetical protein ACPGR8_06915 [Limisphaerales bacterium]
MSAKQTAFTDALVGSTPRGDVIVSSAVGGGTTVLSSRRLNCRALLNLASNHGVDIAIEMHDSSAVAVPRIVLQDNTKWLPATPLTVDKTSGMQATIESWTAAQPQLSSSTHAKMSKRTGSVYTIRIEADGTILSQNLAQLLATPSIVNVFVDSAGLDVWVAKDAVHAGSLSHLSAMGKLSTRFGPPTLTLRAPSRTKARRTRSRLARSGRRYAGKARRPH